MQIFRLFLAALAALVVAGCGGGSGGGSSPFGGPAPASPSASSPTSVAVGDLALTASAQTLNNTTTETVTVTATVVDLNRNTVAGVPVTFSVNNDATLSASGATTEIGGIVTGKVGVGSNRSNRVLTVTATSGSVVRQIAIQVVGARINATPLPAVIAPGAVGVVQYRVVDATGSAMSSVEIVVSGPGGITTTGVTGVNGNYDYSYTAPSTSGNLEIRASAAGVQLTTNILAQSGPGAIPAVPFGTVRSTSVSANPRVVVVNATTSSTNRAEIRALFVGDSNAPIRNVRVRFDLASDANSIGGSFSTGDALVFSDINGVAQSAYIPASRFSPTDGLTIRACWDYNDFPAGTCPNEVRTTLTVVSDPLSVSIGSDNKIVVGDLIYSIRFVVQVNDSSGVPKPDVLISPLLDLPRYRKGLWVRMGSAWAQTVAAECDNEDLNRNGVAEQYGNGVVEDADGDRQLEPRKADAVVAIEGSNRTDASGQVRLRVTYPQNLGSWVDYGLLIAASGVAGTEGRAGFFGSLEVPAEAVKSEAAPPFIVSPYGYETSARVAYSPPTVVTAVNLCTNPR